MRIQRKKSFLKMYEKLSAKKKEKVNETILKFQRNPFDETLKNHALKGEFAGCRSISAGGDLRIIFREFEGYVVVVFLHVGTHSQVY